MDDTASTIALDPPSWSKQVGESGLGGGEEVNEQSQAIRRTAFAGVLVTLLELQRVVEQES